MTAEATANANTTEIDLAWTASTGATSYNLYRSTTAGGEGATPYQTGLSGTTYADKGLTTGTTYYYTLVAVANGSTSAPSAEVSAKAGATLLSAPTLYVTVTGDNAQANLKWPSVSGASYYDIYRTPTTDTSGFYARIPAGSSSPVYYTDYDLTDGTTYTYQVAADGPNGQGSLSNAVSVTPLTAPTITVTSVTAGGVNLSWTASAGATGYNVERSTVYTGVPWTNLAAGVAGTTYSDTSVSAGTAYWYWVQATNADGSSGMSNVVLAQTAPPAPTGLTATAGSGAVALSWTAPSSGTVGSYNIYRGTASGGESLLQTGVTGTSYSDGSMSNGATYYYEVTAVDEGGESVKSNEASARYPYGAPTVATAASASPNPVAGTTTVLSVLGASAAGEGSLTYTWSSTGPASVAYKPNGTNGSKTTTATFPQAGVYTFTATITDLYAGSVTSSVSVTVSQTVSTLILSPASASVAAGGTVPFSASVTDQFGTAMGVVAPAWSVSGGTGTITSGGLYTAPSSSERDTVSATLGNAAATAPVTVTLLVPAAPTGLTATPGTGQVSLSWTAPAGPVSSYNVYRGTSAGGEGTTPVATGISGPIYTDNGLTNGATYYYQVTAVDATGEGAKSGEASARPLYGPPTVATGATVGGPVLLRSGGGPAIVLSALGASPGGANTLTYTWTEALNGSGIPNSISPNGTNAAQETSAPITQTGTYSFTVTITDLYGRSVTSSVSVTVVQMPAAIVVTPNPLSIPIGGTQTFSATVYDEFGNTISGQSLDWSVDNENCSIDPISGVFSAGFFAGTATVYARDGLLYAIASVTITDIAPTVAVAASAAPPVVTGTTVSLSVLGADLAGENTLFYTWSATGPAAVTYSDDGTNTAKTTLAGFTQPGVYTFTVTISDSSGGTVTSSVTVTVVQTLTRISIYPSQTQVALTSSASFSATLLDQFGQSMSGPACTWSLQSGMGSIDASSGLYTAPATTGTAVVEAACGAISGTASITLVDLVPYVVYDANAPDRDVLGATTPLTVLGGDLAGENTLTYTWAASGPAAVTFSANGTNASKDTTATFILAGTYAFTVTITNPSGLSTTSSVTLSVREIGPTVATAASASPNPVTGTTTALSVLGADASGESGLTYTWSSTGPAAATYSANGTNTAKNTMAAFAQAGTYTFTVTVTDLYGGTVTSSVMVTVVQTPTTVTVSPASASVAVGATVQFTPVVADQFGNVIDTPLVAWSITSGSGTITSTGLFTAPSAIETDTVQATSGGVSGTATATVTNPGTPTVTTAASASPDPVTGTTTALSVLGAAPGGESGLTYTWSYTGPAFVTFFDNGTNTAKNTTAGFSQGGTYVLTVMISNTNGTATSSVTVTVNQTGSYLAVTPSVASLSINGVQFFNPMELDQFGAIMAIQPNNIMWSLTSGAGTMTSNGFYVAPNYAGTNTIQASSGDIVGTAQINVYSGSPPPAPPSAPNELSATPGNQQVTLTWTETYDSATSYNIYRADSSGGETQPVLGTTTGTSYTDTSAADNQTYFYVVTAVNSGGESGYSNELSATPFDTPPSITTPITPYSPTVTGTTTTFMVAATSAVAGSSLTYTWATSGPAPVTFSANASSEASTTTATFTQAGEYALTVIIADEYGGVTTSTTFFPVVQTVKAISILPSTAPVIPGGGSYFFQAALTDQFGMPMSSSNATWAVASGAGQVYVSKDIYGSPIAPYGALFSISADLTAPETDTVVVAEGGVSQSFEVQVIPFQTSSHWGTMADLPQYRPGLTGTGTVTEFNPTTEQNEVTQWDGPGVNQGYGTNIDGTSIGSPLEISVSGSINALYFWVPGAMNTPAPPITYLDYGYDSGGDIIGGDGMGNITADDGNGDAPSYTTFFLEWDPMFPDLPVYETQAISSPAITNPNYPPMKVDSSSGMVSFTTPMMKASSQDTTCISVGIFAGGNASPAVSPDVEITSPSNDEIFTNGTVTVSTTLTRDTGTVTLIQLNGPSATPVQSGPDYTFANLASGRYTFYAHAACDDGGGDGGTIGVDSAPVTFYVLSSPTLSVQAGSWSPNPAYVGETISGQAQGMINPNSLDSDGSGPTFVTYSWSTGRVWCSQSGISGTFEPYGGNSAVVWTQGQASTIFSAVFNDAGFYILEVVCTVTVYNNFNGSVIGTITQNGYIGGNAGDIDTGGSDAADAGHTQPDVGSGSTGIPVNPLITIKDANGNTLNSSPTTPITVDAGQQIKLLAQLAPGVILVRGTAHWNFDQRYVSPISNYEYDSKGKVTNLTDQQKASPSITFYWINGWSLTSVDYEGIDIKTGNFVQATVWYKIQKPTCPITAYYGNAGIQAYYDPTSVGHSYVLGLGNSYNSIKGIAFLQHLNSGSQQGTFNWTQVIHLYEAHQYSQIEPGVEANALDTKFDYNNGIQVSQESTQDTPETKWSTCVFPAYFDFTATMYAMWTSNTPHSIPVPLASIDWGFSSSTSIGWLAYGSIYPLNIDQSPTDEPQWLSVFDPPS